MKRHLLYITCGLCTVIAAVNFAAAYINNTKSLETDADAIAVEFEPAASPKSRSVKISESEKSFTNDSLQTNVSITDRQLNRYNLARFYKELKFGTNINRDTLSQYLDILNIPYSSVTIDTPENYCDDRLQILSMSAVYSNYDADNITHFENYARYLWAYTHFIAVNGSSYPATVLIGSNAEGSRLVSGFFDDITDEYQKNGSVTLYITPSEESYYELDMPENFTWSEEKKAEAEALKSMPYTRLIDYILYKNDETVLYSPLPLYNQGSGTWCENIFGGGTIRSDGCCPCSISMVLSYFKNERITPDIIAALYDSDEYRSITNGSYGINMCRQAAADYDLNLVSGNGTLTAEQIEAYLKQDCKIVMSVKGYDAATGTGGNFSSGFHYIALAGITSDGYVIVNNPGYATDITYETAEKVAGNQSGKCYAVFSAK